MSSDLRSILSEILQLYTVPVLSVFFKTRTQLNFPHGNKRKGVHAIVDHLMKEVKTLDEVSIIKNPSTNNIRGDRKGDESSYE